MMYNIPDKIRLANIPTRIEKLEKISAEYKRNIYIKRDDLTGSEISGNKVRKLEYSIAEAIREGADTLITCGALQSNHCRATAACAAKLGLKTELAAKGQKAYIIPTGASNAIGMFGYIEAVKEIKEQEKELGVHFDAIIDTVGSTGTFAGLVLGNKIYEANCDIIGFSVGEDAEYFKQMSFDNIKDCCKYISSEKYTHTPESLGITKEDLNIIDSYRGEGYGISSEKDYEIIKHLARKEGIIVDPVYTGKTFKGLLAELDLSLSKYKNILFIHTGGLFGLFPKAEEMSRYL